MSETKAAEKENVLIQAGDCTAILMPRLGGKIASIRVGNRELLQAPLAAYRARTRTMSFDSSDASGWDECLPSVAACSVDTDDGRVSIPDHGDLWRVEWEEHVPDGKRQPEGAESPVTSVGECFSLPLRMERTVTLTDRRDGSKPGWLLRLDYTLTNTGSLPAPWAWAAHPLFAAEEGDRIVLPESVRELRVEGSAGGRLGKPGSVAQWPVAALADGGRSDLRKVPGPDAEVGDKLFAGPLKESENWCALERPGAGVRIKVVLDAKTTPYLGLWLCYGGWPERPGTKQMCVAMEPATAPVDSLAETGPWSRVLGAGNRCHWRMDVAIETI